VEKISNTWALVVAIGTVLISIAGWLYTQGAASKEFEGRTFTTPEEKVEVVNHVKLAPTPEQQHRALIFDSLERDKTNKMLEQLIKDSYDTKKHIHHMDSIQLLNADQMFQIKEQLKINQ
jgi:hypothetical protein